MKIRNLGYMLAMASLLAQIGCSTFKKTQPNRNANSNYHSMPGHSNANTSNPKTEDPKETNTNRFLNSRPLVNSNKPGGPRNKPTPEQ